MQIANLVLRYSLTKVLDDWNKNAPEEHGVPVGVPRTYACISNLYWSALASFTISSNEVSGR